MNLYWSQTGERGLRYREGCGVCVSMGIVVLERMNDFFGGCLIVQVDEPLSSRKFLSHNSESIETVRNNCLHSGSDNCTLYRLFLWAITCAIFGAACADLSELLPKLKKLLQIACEKQKRTNKIVIVSFCDQRVLEHSPA